MSVPLVVVTILIILDWRRKMKLFSMTKTFFSILLPCVFLLAVSCQTVPSSNPVPSGQAEQERSSQQTFRKENLCSLLTKEEVGAVLKRKMEDPKFFVRTCTYKAVQPSPLKEFSISISTDDGSGFNYNKESAKKEGLRIREVQGIGNGAYFCYGHFHVLKGNHWLTFGTAASSEHHPSEEVIIALAKKAADRLPGPSSEAAEKAPPKGPQKGKEQPGKAMGTLEIGGKTVTMTHAYAFVDQKDKRKPVLILITDRAVPADQWKSESDMTRYRFDNPFMYVCFWIDKDRQEFRREHCVDKIPASTMGVFDLKLAPSDPGTFTGTVKKDGKEVSFTAVLIK
jgi:hypothetical protein